MDGSAQDHGLAVHEDAERGELQAAVRLLRSQNRLTEAILAQQDLAGLAVQSVETIRQELRLAGAALAVLEDEGTVFSLVHQHGCSAAALALIDSLNLRDPGPSPGKDAILARRMLNVPCGDAHVLMSPVTFADRPIGLLLALSPAGNRFTEEDLVYVDAIRAPLARALDGVLRAAELKRSKEVLERVNREFRDMVRDLSVANEKLKEIDRLKDSFVSSVSHELRTPLTSIRGFAEILLDYGTEDPHVSREFLTIIRDESDRLGRLIRNILDLSRLEAGERQWEIGPVEIDEIVATAASVLKPQLEAEGRRFEVTIDRGLPPLQGDRDGLIQVLVNLLGNAAKFTRPGGTVRLSAHRCGLDGTAGDGGYVRVDVADDGIGIPGAEIARIFEKFRQVNDPLAAKQVGTGLGLPICREILTHFGGRIWAESAAGKGSVFRFTVPAALLATDSGTIFDGSLS